MLLNGCGIEYAWGMSKKWFRRNNDCVSSTLQSRIEHSLSKDVLPLSRIWRFERRARSYMYMYLDNTTCQNYEQIEQAVTKYKTHRNIEEIEREYLAEEMNAVLQAINE